MNSDAAAGAAASAASAAASVSITAFAVVASEAAAEAAEAAAPVAASEFKTYLMNYKYKKPISGIESCNSLDRQFTLQDTVLRRDSIWHN